VTRREQLVVSVGIGSVLAAVILLRALPAAVHRYSALIERSGVSGQLVARREAELALLPILERRADSLRRRVLALADRLVPGATEAEAQAELLVRVEHAAADPNGQLEQAEAVPDSIGFGRLRRVQARAAWSSDLTGILGFLRRLEYGQQLLVVRRVWVEAISGAAQPDHGDRLRAEVVVEGWYLRREEAGL